MRNHFVLAAALTLMAILACSFAGWHAWLGPSAILFFVLLALSLGRSEQWRRLAFTAWIVAAVTASLFYPAPFRELWGFDLRRLIIPLLMVIMFGMGTAMSLRDFAGVLRMPKGVFVGLLCQFTIMPFVGFGLTKLFSFPPEIAAGLILVGCSPSGLASNVMSFIARANLALSLTLTAIATLLAPALTPLLMSLLAGQLVPIDAWGMTLDILRIVILPVIAGLFFNHFFYERFPWLARWMPRLSMVGIAIIIAIITAAGRDSLLSVGLALLLATALHNAAGYFLGYWASRLSGLDRQSCRTIALEVGLQNSGLASGLALEMGKVATMGLAPAVFGPLMNVTGSGLASWWRERG